MEEGQIVLKLHEELIKTNRDLQYFKDECLCKFRKQKRINRLLICCLISLMAKSAIKNVKNINGKGTADPK